MEEETDPIGWKIISFREDSMLCESPSGTRRRYLLCEDKDEKIAKLKKQIEESNKSLSQDHLRNMIVRDGQEKTNQHIASRLRQIADIVESGKYPQVFSWFDSQDDGLIAVDVRIQLSYPWPG